VFSGGFDAIIGLAYPTMAEPNFTPFFDTLMRDGLVERNLFAFYMSMNPLENDSELTFGSYDEDRIDGELLWHPVIDKLFWSLNLEDIRLGDKSLGLCDGLKCLVTPDSGTSLSTMPTWAYKEFIDQIGGWDQNCEIDADFDAPDMIFVIDGHEYVLPSHHWLERKIDETVPEGGRCTPAISPLDILQTGQENLFILGDKFMQIYYTIFDRDSDQVGFALAKHEHPELHGWYDNNTGMLVDYTEVSTF